VSWSVRAATTLFGFALAIAIAPSLQKPARPGELPGALQAAGLSASGPPWQFVFVVLVTIGFALLSARIVPLVIGKRWVAASYSIALASAPITLMHFGNARHLALHALTAAAIVWLRRLEPRFSRADAVLVPTLLSFYFTFLDLNFGRTPAATFLRAAIAVFALRLIVGAISPMRRPGRAFAFAPLAFAFQLQLFSPIVSGWLSLLWLIATPLIAQRIPREENVARLATWVAYPLVACLYPLALLGAGSAPIVDVFEDGHDVLPASEMTRGETPYTDIILGHGFIADGGLNVVAMNLGADSLGSILTTRRAVGVLSLGAVYFVALAAAGSADLALLAVFLTVALFPGSTIAVRPFPALLALAAVGLATRLRSKRLFIAAGALLVVAFLDSIDFAIYSGLVAIVAAIRSRAIKPLAIGLGVAGAIALLLLGIGGFFTDFFRVTFTEILGGGSVYIIAPLVIPDALRSLSVLAVRLDEWFTLAILGWVIALIASATILSRSPLRARRSDAIWYLGAWVIVAGASYVERQHVYLTFVLPAFFVGALVYMYRRQRVAAIALAVLLVLLIKPFGHIFDVASPLRRSHGMHPGDAVAVDLPRARGAMFDPASARALEAAQRFMRTLRPNETFVDFANAGLLYYLFDRDCPLRQVEVPQYEHEAAQREVIARLERNRSVRAALMVFPSAYSAIDEVPNAARAPLVYAYLERNFVPSFAEDGVVFWRRR
jgi:hypothetical protein